MILKYSLLERVYLYMFKKGRMSMSRNHKKFIAASVSTAVVASAFATVAPINVQKVNAAGVEAGKFFTDVSKENTLYREILDLYNQGAIDGFTDGTFRPQETVTRGQAAKMISGILKLDTKSVQNPSFTDVKEDKWYYETVAALVQKQVVGGFKDGTFRPDQSLTGSEAAKMISEAFALKYDAEAEVPFKDIAKEKWHFTYVQALVADGVQRKNERYLCP